MLAALPAAHEAHLLAMADLHRQFIAQQQVAAVRILPLRRHEQASRKPVAHVAPAGAVQPGPRFTRAQLEELATMRCSVSSLFGPEFAGQDAHRYQIRLPAPPMLFTDRVLAIEGTPGSLGSGRLWAEVDVAEDMFGLDPAGRASTFLMGEAGQANMLLASWLGADLSHDGQSRYRILDIDVVMRGSPARSGETLRNEITLERQAVVGGLRLFFLKIQASANGRLVARASLTAGLFTEAELAQPGGLDWSPARDARASEGPFEVTHEFTRPRSFTPRDMAALSDGRVADCFGESHRRAATHVRTPRAAMPELFLLDSVTAVEPTGGPSGRGYLRATQLVTPDDWYFAAHLPGDSCMPGFLLLEGAMQSLAFYLTAMGLTIPRDGWRFEPATDARLGCRFRGQVVPQSATIVYEVFAESVSADPVPRIVADVVARLDERIIFHGRRLALQLVPDWPLEQFRSRRPRPGAFRGTGPQPLPGDLAGRNPDPKAATVDGIEVGYPSLLAFAWGRAQDAFGARMAVLDGTSRWARSPAPPFLFITRVTAIEARAGDPRPGSRIMTSWDIPETAWFFTESGGLAMPFAILLEALLQPSGWLMLFVCPLEPDGQPLTGHVRNLDGVVTVHAEVTPGPGCLDVAVELESMVGFGGTVLFALRIEASIAGRLIGEARTTFGFFSPQALEEQAGLPATAQERARISGESERVTDLRTAPERFFSGSLRLPGPHLLMVDRVTAFDPAGGPAGLGWARGEKTVDPDEWFFKAHFFQDPVQPGSLGLEMLLQLLQVVMIERDMGLGVPDARFEPVITGREVAWKYRGQVLPENRCVIAEVELKEAGRDDRGPFIIADGWLWVDGVRVYKASGLGMRILCGSA
jgi:3-hydroxymyristoyl/3-hydroxydecanoyl-(acyl carrier protein) dehydratase